MKALIFDLDGTLVDTVYAHVFAWQPALAEAGLPIDGWRIHRRIGMTGGLFTRAVAREAGRALTDAEAEAIHADTASCSASCCQTAGRCLALANYSRSCGTRASRTGSRPPVGGPRSTHDSRLSACRPT
jgi:beta-phosphoglucomutase-like phosphatase (HAD superfamily)